MNTRSTATASSGANSGLHLILPEPEFARRNRLDHNPSIGEGIRLLQLSSDYGLGYMFGVCGIVDFWIAEEDLRAGRFDRAYGAMACT